MTETMEQLKARLKEKLQARERRYKELRTLPKETLVRRVNQSYRVHGANLKTAKADLIGMILDAELSVRSLERRIARIA